MGKSQALECGELLTGGETEFKAIFSQEHSTGLLWTIALYTQDLCSGMFSTNSMLPGPSTPNPVSNNDNVCDFGEITQSH